MTKQKLTATFSQYDLWGSYKKVLYFYIFIFRFSFVCIYIYKFFLYLQVFFFLSVKLFEEPWYFTLILDFKFLTIHILLNKNCLDYIYKNILPIFRH